MSWFLKIDLPQQEYKAGDTVSGSVCLVTQHTNGQEVDVGSITLDLTGRSTTAKSWPRIPKVVRLFSFRKALFAGPQRLYAPFDQSENDGRSKWPFSFTLPRDCSFSTRDSVASTKCFNPDPNQPLPISFADDNIQDGSCSIVYELQATLMTPLKDGYHVNEYCIKKVEILVYRPRSINQLGSISNEKCANFTHRSLLLLLREERKLAHRPLTIKEKMKLQPPSTDHLPKAVFTVRLQTPSAAVIGQRLPLMLHIDYDLDASTVPPPIFYLKRVGVHLCEETSIWGLKSIGELEPTRWTKEITLQESWFDTQRPRVKEHLDLTKVMDIVVYHGMTPTFRTFHIARTYSLKVFVRLECAGKEHLVFGDYKRCTLLAEEYYEPLPVVDGEDIDPPPPYHFIAQEAVPEYSTQAHLTGSQERGHAGQNGGALLDASGSVTGAAT